MKLNLLKILLLLICLTSCEKKESPKPLSDLELKKVSFDELKGWDNDDVTLAKDAFLRSCERLQHKTSQYIGNSEIKISSTDFKNICLKAKNNTELNFRQFVEDNFTPYLVIYKGSSKGRFTAYYEPQIMVSANQTDKYKYPIHAKPLDMIEFNPNDFDASLPSKQLVGRILNNKLVPYFSREEINAGKGNVPVLLWSDSLVDVFVMHIQGPAVAVFEDGRKIRISYAGTNGLPFTGIGSLLLKNNEIKPAEASMGKIKEWLLKNKQKAVLYMNQNKRYVFHQLIGASGPLGALNVPLAAGRSMAVDTNFVPLGALLWVDTILPDGSPLQKLVNAQDVGGAIKGAIRGDYFWGSGGDEILEKAGKMNSEGSYYIFIPNKGE